MLRAASLLFIQIILTGWVETKRLMDFRNPGTQDNWLGEGGQFKPMDNGYPGGGFFDPFGLSRGSKAQLRKYQVCLRFAPALHSCCASLTEDTSVGFLLLMNRPAQCDAVSSLIEQSVICLVESAVPACLQEVDGRHDSMC